MTKIIKKNIYGKNGWDNYLRCAHQRNHLHEEESEEQKKKIEEEEEENKEDKEEEEEKKIRINNQVDIGNKLNENIKGGNVFVEPKLFYFF